MVTISPLSQPIASPANIHAVRTGLACFVQIPSPSLAILPEKTHLSTIGSPPLTYIPPPCVASLYSIRQWRNVGEVLSARTPPPCSVFLPPVIVKPSMSVLELSPFTQRITGPIPPPLMTVSSAPIKDRKITDFPRRSICSRHTPTPTKTVSPSFAISIACIIVSQSSGTRQRSAQTDVVIVIAHKKYFIHDRVILFLAIPQ